MHKFKLPMNLQFHAEGGTITDRTDTDALIPEQVSRDIIQGVTEESAVLSKWVVYGAETAEHDI